VAGPDQPPLQPVTEDSGDSDVTARRKHRPAKPTAARIWLHADSGFGKSVQMVVIEQTIAAAPDQRVPIRLGRTPGGGVSLSEHPWNTTHEETLKEFLINLLLQHIDDSDRQYAEEWLKRIVRHSSAVFLLDALDQTSGSESLLGLGRFLNTDALILDCVAVVAGRDDAWSNNPMVFDGGRSDQWCSVKVREFQRGEQERFLGRRVRPILLTDATKEQWDTKPEDARHLMWKDLLGVPLLLKKMKKLASETNRPLNDVSNRYSLYELTVQHILKHSTPTLTGKSGRKVAELLLELDEVLGAIAWYSVSGHDFSACLTGSDYLAATAPYRAQLDNLIQINLLGSLLDRCGQVGLEWRHRSFCEYFAGKYLMSVKAGDRKSPAIPFVSAEDRDAILQEIHKFSHWSEKNGTDGDRPSAWHWTLRFALCHAAEGAARDDLALELIQHGNPWIVYEAIDRDGLKLSDDVEQLTRWLVHWDSSDKRDYTDAYKDGQAPPESIVACWQAGKVCGKLVSELSETMLSSAIRDASYVGPLLELMSLSSGQPQWQRRLGGSLALPEAHHISGTSSTGMSVADWIPQSDEPRLVLPAVYLQHPATNVLNRFVESFIPLPEGEFDPSKYHDLDKLKRAGVEITGKGKNERVVPIPMAGLHMSSFFVTNELFEVYSPWHRKWRDQHSDQDDQPVVYVSWYMARSFCEWLTRILGPVHGGIFCLPTEWQWEWAVRWGDEHTAEYWWGDEWRPELAWVGNNPKTQNRSHSLSESLAELCDPKSARSDPKDQHPGLIDPEGNVSCWCGNRTSALGFDRSLRGTSFNDKRGYNYDHSEGYVQISFRCDCLHRGSYDVGFRVVWLRMSPQSSSGFSD